MHTDAVLNWLLVAWHRDYLKYGLSSTKIHRLYKYLPIAIMTVSSKLPLPYRISGNIVEFHMVKIFTFF